MSARAFALAAACASAATFDGAAAHAAEGPFDWKELAHPGARAYAALMADAEAHLAGGRSLASTDHGDDAIPALEAAHTRFLEAAAIWPSRPEPYVGAATSLMSLGAHGPAAALLEDAARVAAPTDPLAFEIFFRLGACYRLDGHAARAVTALGRALLLAWSADDLSDALRERGLARMADADVDGAVADLRASVRFHRDAANLTALAVALDRAGDDIEARRTMARAIASDPRGAVVAATSDFRPPEEAQYWRALRHEVDGALGDALAEWAGFLAVASPSNPWRARAELHLDTLRAASRLRDAASIALTRAVALPPGGPLPAPFAKRVDTVLAAPSAHAALRDCYGRALTAREIGGTFTARVEGVLRGVPLERLELRVWSSPASETFARCTADRLRPLLGTLDASPWGVEVRFVAATPAR